MNIKDNEQNTVHTISTILITPPFTQRWQFAVVYAEFDVVLCHCVDLHNATTRRTVVRGPVRKNWSIQQRLNIRRMVHVYAVCAVMQRGSLQGHALGLCCIIDAPTLILSVCGGSLPSVKEFRYSVV